MGPRIYNLDREPRVLAHTDGPDTAKEAAAANIAGKILHRYDLLERYQRLGPGTTEYVWLIAPASMDLAEVRRRATDLLATGLLERTGETKKTTSGRQAEVLRISAAGRRLLETLAREAR